VESTALTEDQRALRRHGGLCNGPQHHVCRRLGTLLPSPGASVALVGGQAPATDPLARQLGCLAAAVTEGVVHDHQAPFHWPVALVWRNTCSWMRRLTTGESAPSTIRSSNTFSRTAGVSSAVYTRRTCRQSSASTLWPTMVLRSSVARLQWEAWSAAHHCSLLV